MSIEPQNSKVNDLISRAMRLAVELQDCGHEIFCLDILDALASSSLTLSEALNNTPSDAYLTLVEALERYTAGETNDL